MAKGKKRLKKWSFQRAAPKQTVSVQPFPWDMGANTLAARLGGRVDDHVTKFAEYVRATKPEPKTIKEIKKDKESGEELEIERQETEAEMLRRVAKDFSKLGREEGTLLEDRGEINPITGKRENPNGVKGARRVDMLEVWHSRYLTEKRNPRSGELSPYITTRQFNAATTLRDAFEQTARAPGWPDNDKVQSSVNPTQAVTIQIDRLSRYHRVARHVAKDDRAIVDWCVLQGRSPKGTGKAFAAGHAALRAALDRLADGLEGNS